MTTNIIILFVLPPTTITKSKGTNNEVCTMQRHTQIDIFINELSNMWQCYRIKIRILSVYVCLLMVYAVCYVHMQVIRWKDKIFWNVKKILVYPCLDFGNYSWIKSVFWSLNFVCLGKFFLKEFDFNTKNMVSIYHILK